ncbi:uncharacterized protein BT62DRAFT_1061699 [Guyanagaster necrorhizus]|uniref:F-box domain-containing protein n=1 Tax=Guyanagaster necrorhizus TaxID=856835 RepID=A0A9P7VX75_9AGAR|nr:uncharacterized protein BT62DRAFT_1061699 [Guyanagaster necrorhizus MCA 3950]KAG7447854.1 hypothetical protein BT62DRAFT_1061699 [Guyanagaster necrorhizus MCA 3950]
MDELLESNNPPLDAKHIQLEGVIGEGHWVLAGPQEWITQTWAVLEALLNEERHVNHLIESCKTILHPILMIPEDIIHKIFLTHHFEAIEREGRESLNGQFVLLVLSHVCRDWRRIALLTSWLWPFIMLDFNVYKNEQACQNLLQMYLLWSMIHDITLSIYSEKDLSKSHLTPVLLLSMPWWIYVSMVIPYNWLHAFSTT